MKLRGEKDWRRGGGSRNASEAGAKLRLRGGQESRAYLGVCVVAVALQPCLAAAFGSWCFGLRERIIAELGLIDVVEIRVCLHLVVVVVTL